MYERSIGAISEIPAAAASLSASLSAVFQAAIASASLIHIIAPVPAESPSSIDWIACSSASRCSESREFASIFSSSPATEHAVLP